MTGMLENSEVILNQANQRAAATVVLQINARIAEAIGINQAARATCVKPEGTSSCLLGTSSGTHPHHAKRYIRRQQANALEAPLQHFTLYNPGAVENSVWSANNTDKVIAFPIEVEDGAKTKNQTPALELLKLVKKTQNNWVKYGKREDKCAKTWLAHNVSNTISIKDDEWDKVIKFIYNNRENFCGISLLPESGDKDYPQAPFVTVHTSREIVKEYGEAAIWCSGLIELALQAFNNDLWKACDEAFNGLDKKEENIFKEINRLKIALNGKSMPAITQVVHQGRLQTEWIQKFHKFAERYFEKDLKKLSYCLKDVFNWKLYCDLNRTFQHVDYTTMIEEEDNTKPEAELACAGGSCQI